MAESSTFRHATFRWSWRKFVDGRWLAYLAD